MKKEIYSVYINNKYFRETECKEDGIEVGRRSVINNKSDNYKVNKELIIYENDTVTFVCIGCVAGESLDRETGQWNRSTRHSRQVG